ncbi:two-component system response regulator NreC [Dysgonomonas sp. PH5-45]|uniref:LuxR C-terminal-related transcriptional regulator n=1 Tax=unclassified Dysgonomonas TaxID=2630389 RepID=UPI00247669B7|nr:MULTISPECIES: LuxR C-terminal-related transcriptional regulator [unclassified Dysgonomonas]MDH6354901.1 two-component system response regulator NreC [Dysgonomonas sp. PH5-45]MDH6387800.1 two-component system response regulator NreC [Dysgonomonas sp. PH5-37]
MRNIKKILAVAETSYIIRKGLVYALSQLPMVAKVVEIKDFEDINQQLNIIKPDGVIVNPMLFGHTSKHDVKQQLKLDKETAVVALVYNMIDERFYRSYDAVIQINDSERKLEETLSNALNDNKEPESGQEDLSDREKEILISIVRGMSNKEIAEHHSISIHTVITHRRNIGRKLEIHSVSGLTIYAIVNKLVDIKEIKY